MDRRRRLNFEPLEDRRLLTTITVNTLLDVNNSSDGLTTLREAVVAAAPNDTINFSVNGTINLADISTGHILINKNLTIQGPGANLLTLKAFDPDADGKKDSDGFRAFLVSDGNSSNLINVTISGLTITGGDPKLDPGPEAAEHTFGGGIRSFENLTVIGCVVTGNFTVNGGGIGNGPQTGSTGPFNGTLTVIDSVISGNSANDGGALFTQRGNMVATRTTMENNNATNAGGAVFNLSGNLTLVDSSISGNEADNPESEASGRGAGVCSFYGDVTINGTTISGNHAAFLGGGIFFNNNGTLTVTSSTISGNTADEKGGGVYVYYYVNQPVSFAHSTITGNSAGTSGGGIVNGSSDIDVQLDHTIVAGNLRGSSRDDLGGDFDAKFSLIGDRRSASVSNLGGSLIGTSSSPINALLGALANNGGPTKTHALLSGSPALEAGNPAAVAGVSGIPQFDQRGMPFSRLANFDGPGGARIDIGAVEMAPPAPALPGDYNVNALVDASDYVLWRKTAGSNVPPYSGADGDGNGLINIADYNVWRSNFGSSSSPGAGTGSSDEVVLGVSTIDSMDSSALEQRPNETPGMMITEAATWFDRSLQARAVSADSLVQKTHTVEPSTASNLLVDSQPLYRDDQANSRTEDICCPDESQASNEYSIVDQLFAENLGAFIVTWPTD